MKREAPAAARNRQPILDVLIQILLPATQTDANRSALARTRDELTTRHGGVTAYVRSPARGAWRNPSGHEEHDDVIMVEVIVSEFDRAHWRAYAKELAVRFDEQEIHVRVIPAEVL